MKVSKDNSMKTAYIVVVFCMFIGFLTNGFGGAIVGAAFGFAAMVIVSIAQEVTKNH